MPSADEVAAVELCRAVAKQTIEDIAREWTRNQISGWNAVWFMYQASMIPLVSMFWESWNTNKVREWQSQIEIVLESFADMADWSLAARRSREVVSRMYEASKGPITRQGSPGLMQNGNTNQNGAREQDSMLQEMDGSQNQAQHEMMMEEGMVLLDNQSIWDLDGMLWGNLPDGLDMPFDGIPEMEYADPTQGNYDGAYMMHP